MNSDVIKKLAVYLESAILGFSGLTSIEKFEGGQSNPTYLLKAATGRYVLRRKPAGVLLKSAHAVDREFRVLDALSKTEVPVPKVYHLCEDDSVIGSAFYIMAFMEGRNFWNPVLPDIDKSQRQYYYAEMNRVAASIHNVDIASVNLHDYGKSSSYFERQIARWTKQYRASETEVIPEMEALIRWLPECIPTSSETTCLVHGDYRLDNFIFHPTEAKIIAVLDWELSTLGHPYADLAYQCMQLRMPNDSVLKGLGGLDRASLGLPTEKEYVQHYCNNRGIEGIECWEFYLVFSYFRFAAILQGVLKRSLEGNASNANATEMGRLTKPLAEMAVKLI